MLEAMAAGTEVIRRRRKFDAISLLRTHRADGAQASSAETGRLPANRPSVRRRHLQGGHDRPLQRSAGRLLARGLDRGAVGRAAGGPTGEPRLVPGVHRMSSSATPPPSPCPTTMPPNSRAVAAPRGPAEPPSRSNCLWEILTGAVRELVIEAGKSSDATSPIAHEGLPAGSLVPLRPRLLLPRTASAG